MSQTPTNYRLNLISCKGFLPHCKRGDYPLGNRLPGNKYIKGQAVTEIFPAAGLAAGDSMKTSSTKDITGKTGFRWVNIVVSNSTELYFRITLL
jgi:hypothetical protein